MEAPTICSSCKQSDTFTKYQCMKQCGYQAHAACIQRFVRYGPFKDADPSMPICQNSDCDARWLDWPMQFINAIAEYEIRAGFKLSEVLPEGSKFPNGSARRRSRTQ